MEESILLTPPLAFIIVLAVSIFLLKVSSCFSARGKDTTGEGRKGYACGEDFSNHLIQPDYSQFFPFAFFFTILHVVALTIATVPVENMTTFAIAVVYIGGAVIGLSILLRR